MPVAKIAIQKIYIRAGRSLDIRMCADPTRFFLVALDCAQEADALPEIDAWLGSSN
jgi:hypothetical protein